ncbi:MAG: glycosyltransferase [Acidobacteria bacterium]|nr:glycosyltransferase [Acidobacteriota bacterium]
MAFESLPPIDPAPAQRSVLLIAAAFPPLNSSGTQRALQFARLLPRHGWRPVVVTLDWEREPLGNPLDFELLDQVPASVPTYRLPYFNPPLRLGEWLRRHRREGAVTRHGGSTGESWDRPLAGTGAPRKEPPGFLYRLARRGYHFSIAPIGDEHFYWAWRARRACRAIARRHRVNAILVSVSPWSSALLGLSLQRRLGLPLVVDFRDYWTEWAVRDRPRLRDALERIAERRILRRADRILCVHQAMADDFVALEPRLAGRCHVITNGFDAADFEDGRTGTEHGAVVRHPILVHTGVAWGDCARPLLEAVARARTELRASGLRVRMVGGLYPEGERFIAREGLEDLVTQVPRVPHRAAIAEMRAADGLLLLLVNNDGGRKWYPGKLFEYFAARRPILAVAPQGIATRLIQTMGAGVGLDPSDVPGIARTLVDFARDRSRFCDQHYALREDLLAGYERTALVARLADVLEQVATDRMGTR